MHVYTCNQAIDCYNYHDIKLPPFIAYREKEGGGKKKREGGIPTYGHGNENRVGIRI